MQLKFYFPNISKLLLVVAACLVGATVIKAEGSKDFWDYPGYRLFFNAEQQQQLKVYARAGEFINVGASHVGITGGFIVVYRPDGSVAARFDGSDGTAIIHNDVEELAGPTGGSSSGTGYIPGVVPVSSETEGVWTIQLGFPDYTRGAFDNIMNGTSWDRATHQPLVQRSVLAWDATVTQGAAGNALGVPIEGRVYSNEYISIQNGNNIMTSPSFYILTKDGYIYQIDFNDTDPWGFPLFSNSFGIVNGNQQPTYSSLADSSYTRSANPTEWESNQNYLYDPQAKDIGSLINNKIFFNPPDETMPTKAMVTDIFNQDSHTTWLFNPITAEVPELTAVFFSGILEESSECDPLQNTKVGLGGFICFTANTNGIASVKLDMNNNNSFEDAVDRDLSAFVSLGKDSVYWDGRDGLGNVVDHTLNLQINYNIESRSGEVHILMLDVENNPGGVTFTRMNGSGSPDDQFYYDHTLIGGGVSGGVPGNPTATNTPYVYSDRFGDNLLLDYWTFIEFPNPATGSFTINVIDDCEPPVTNRVDSDQDGVADLIDLDDDNDGIPDLMEYCNAAGTRDCAIVIDPSGDADGDLIPNYQDAQDAAINNTCADVDNDGICDQLDLAYDLDGDGVPDHLDLDSDNDGITDLVEAGHGQLDDNLDGVIDGLANLFGQNGLFNVLATHADSLTATLTYFISDKDKDQIADYKDLDTDNDGIHDVREGNFGSLDTNNDGRIDDGEGNVPTVTAQGLPMLIIPDTSTISIALPPDTDQDGISDWRDLDTDNDGINDVLENIGSDADADGLIGEGLPVVNANGVVIDNTATVFATSTPTDTDGDQLPDFRDLDSDADGIFDVHEVNQPDPDNDGILGMGIPSVNRDGQSIEDATGTSLTMISNPVDGDNDSLPDFQDTDRDADGIPDSYECPGGWPCLDTDGDAIFDVDDLDSDGDLLLDVDECAGGVPCLDENNNEIDNFREFTCHELTTPIIQITTTSITNLCGGASIPVGVTKLDSLAIDSFSYQWTGPNGFVESGMTTDINTLQLEGVATSGTYSLVVTTPEGCSSVPTSTEIALMDSLTVPVLRLSKTFACTGENVMLTVDSSDLPITSYSWFFDNRDTTILIATTETGVYQLTNLREASTGNYIVRTTIEGCTATNSAPVALTITPRTDSVEVFAFAFTEDPVCAGSPITLSVFELDMDSVVYDWYGPNGFVATGTSIEIDTSIMGNSGQYYAEVNIANCTFQSNEIDVAVKPRPEKTPAVILSTSSFCAGDALTLSTASVEGDSVSYQWYFDNGMTQELIAVTSDSILQLDNLERTNSGDYAVMVDLAGCTSDMSAVEKISVFPSLEGVAINTSLDSLQLACVGSSVELQIGDLDSTAVISWAGPNNFTSAQNSIILDTFNSQLAGAYSAEIVQGNCTSTTGEVNLRIAPIPSVPELDLLQEDLCAGEPIELVIEDATTDSITYQWFFNGAESEEDLSTLLGTTSAANFSVENTTMDNSGVYSVAAVVGNCASEVSDPVIVLLQPPLDIEIATSLTDGTSTCEGTNVELRVTEIEGATYEWVGPNGIFAATNTTNLDSVLTSQSGAYYAKVTADGCTTTSTEIEVAVQSTPASPSLSFAKDDFCFGENIALSIATEREDTDSQYEWYEVVNEELTLLANTQVPNFNILNATEENTGTYAVVATIGGCSSAPSATQFISVQPSLEVVATSSAQSLTPACQGDEISFDVPEIRGATYEWYGPDGLFSQLRTPNVDVAQANISGRYYAIVTSGGCSERTEPIDVLVNEIPNVPALSVDQNSLCSGEVLQLNATITNGSNINYNWYLNNGEDRDLLVSTVEPTLIIDQADVPNDGQYSVEVSVDGCTSSVSNIQDISVSELLGNLKATSNATLSSPACSGERIILTATDVDGAEYEWYGPNGIVSRNKGFTLPNATIEDAGKYYAQITIGGCSKRTNEIDVIVNNQPPVPFLQSRANSLCVGEQIDLATSAYSGFSVRYNWYFNDGSDEDILVITTSTPNFSFSDATEGVAGNYSVEVVVDGCTSTKSNSQLIDIQTSLEEIEAFSSIVSNKPICEGEELSLFTTPVEDATYEWYGPNGLVSDQPSPSIITNSVNQSGQYYAVVSFDGCSAVTNEVNVRVLPKPEKPEIFTAGRLCTGDVLELSATSYEGDNISYSWMFSDGKASTFLAATDNPTYPISNTSPTNSGFYSVNVNVDGCTASSSNVEKVEIQAPLENMIITSSKNTACSGEAIDFAAPFVAGATYEWFGPNNFSSTLVNPRLAEVPMEATGEYFAVVTLDGCPNTTSKVNLDVKAQPEQPFLAAEEMQVCVAEEAVLKATNSPNVITNRELFYQWYRASANQLIGETQEGILRIPNASEMETGNYFVELTNEGCTSEPSNMVFLEVDAAPEESAFILDESSSFCAESRVVVEAVDPTIGTGKWSVPNSNAKIIDAANPMTTIDELDKGGNTIIWSLSYKGCDNYSSDTIFVSRETSSVLAQNDEYTININRSLTTANLLENDRVDGVANYEITILNRPAFGKAKLTEDGMVEYIPNPNFFGYDEFQYEICNTACGDMCDQASVRINIVDETKDIQCFAPNIITPNGDGLNDGFKVPCVDQLENPSELKIFNRWGDIVYQTADYQNEWTGTYNGKPLPPGTYFYLLRVGEDQTECLQGYFQMLR